MFRFCSVGALTQIYSIASSNLKNYVHYRSTCHMSETTIQKLVCIFNLSFKIKISAHLIYPLKLQSKRLYEHAVLCENWWNTNITRRELQTVKATQSSDPSAEARNANELLCAD